MHLYDVYLISQLHSCAGLLNYLGWIEVAPKDVANAWKLSAGLQARCSVAHVPTEVMRDDCAIITEWLHPRPCLPCACNGGLRNICQSATHVDGHIARRDSAALRHLVHRKGNSVCSTGLRYTTFVNAAVCSRRTGAGSAGPQPEPATD
jgi:hypothetical protein